MTKTTPFDVRLTAPCPLRDIVPNTRSLHNHDATEEHCGPTEDYLPSGPCSALFLESQVPECSVERTQVAYDRDCSLVGSGSAVKAASRWEKTRCESRPGGRGPEPRGRQERVLHVLK